MTNKKICDKIRLIYKRRDYTMFLTIQELETIKESYLKEIADLKLKVEVVEDFIGLAKSKNVETEEVETVEVEAETEYTTTSIH